MGKKESLKSYVEVKDRIKLYKEVYPDMCVRTDVVQTFKDGDVVIIRATIFKSPEDLQSGKFHSMGIAEETRDAGYINKTSHVENCETSAIGRAFANVGFTGSDERPSAEEMDKVKRTKAAKAKPKAKEVEKVEDESPATDSTEDEIIDTITGFDKKEDLVKWFNKAAEEADNTSAFQQNYLSAVKEQLSKLG